MPSVASHTLRQFAEDATSYVREREEADFGKIFATRADDDSGGGGGISGGAIAGIIIAVLAILAVVSFLFVRSRRSVFPIANPGDIYPYPRTSNKPYPIAAQTQAQPSFLPQYVGPRYPAASIPHRGRHEHEHGHGHGPNFLPTVLPDIRSEGVFYAPRPAAPAPPGAAGVEKGVRFGHVGVRRFG